MTHPPLTAEQIKNRKRWIAALRSGAYLQGRDQMFNPGRGTYCCLGVAEDMFTGKARDVHSSCSAPAVKDALGFVLPNYASREEEYLARRNDGGDAPRSPSDSIFWTFEEIADLIEQALPGRVS